ncbi:MAG TPA: TIGR03000 domain-containing protein [Gemmataceae bacterium]|nr:TIGR03000 domain-containing protein [Gemmataceae bacterium]
MLRIHTLACITALGVALCITPESHAQKGGHVGGGARIGSAPRVGSAPRIGSAPHINSAPRIQPSIQSNALRVNPAIGGVAGRPSAGISNLQSAKILPGNMGLQHGNFQPSRFNSQPFHNQNFHNQNFHGDHRHNNNNFAFVAFSPFLGLGYWPGFWDNPYYSFYPPLGLYDYPAPYAAMPYLPGYDPGFATQPPVQSGVSVAQIDVFVPDPNAQVFFDGSQTSSKGSTRYFDSPPLQPGGTYTYTIRAVWNQGGQSMSAESAVTVTAGSQVVLDFTQSPPKVTRVR